MEIRPVKPADIDQALELINTEGWEYSKEEIERMLVLDPKGSFFFVDKKPVGVITTISTGRTGVVGHLVVSKDARGRKVGQSLIEHAIGYFEGNGMDSVVLYATPDGERLYKRFGFSVRGMAYATKACYDGEFAGIQTESVRKMVPHDLDEVVAMDGRLFGDDRGRLIRHLYGEFPDQCYAQERDGRIIGYAFGRVSSVARDFGPWGCSSTSKRDAEDLFGVCMESLGRGPVFFGVFSANQRAWEIANRLRILRAWPTSLMVRGCDRYAGTLNSLYGIIGFELG